MPPPPSPPTPPPHASTPPARVTISISIPSKIRQLRRLGRMQNSRMQAKAEPPVAYQGTPGRAGSFKAALVDAVVTTVRIAVPALFPEMLTGLVEPKLNAGGSWAPLGPEVIDADSATPPVNPPLGEMVTVKVFPVIAPGAIVTAVPEMVNVGGGTITEI